MLAALRDSAGARPGTIAYFVEMLRDVVAVAVMIVLFWDIARMLILGR